MNSASLFIDLWSLQTVPKSITLKQFLKKAMELCGFLGIPLFWIPCFDMLKSLSFVAKGYWCVANW